MTRSRVHFLFLNVGHFLDHLFLLVFASAAALTLARDWGMSYAELRDEAARVAQALLAEGVAPGERVAVLDRNTPEYFTFLFGAAMANAVTLAVNWRLAPREMEYILENAEARVLLVGEEFLGHLAKMKLDGVRRIVVLGESGGKQLRYEDWIADRAPEDPRVPTKRI